jgi:hypothetical protein
MKKDSLVDCNDKIILKNKLNVGEMVNTWFLNVTIKNPFFQVIIIGVIIPWFLTWYHKDEDHTHKQDREHKSIHEEDTHKNSY